MVWYYQDFINRYDDSASQDLENPRSTKLSNMLSMHLVGTPNSLKQDS